MDRKSSHDTRTETRSDMPTQRPKDGAAPAAALRPESSASLIVPDEDPAVLERPTPVVSDAEELAIWMSAAVSQVPAATAKPESENAQRSEGMYRFFLAGDRAAAANLAQQILAEQPHDVVATSVFRQCMDPADIDGADGVLEVLVPLASLSAGDLDPRESGVLARIDGVATLDQVLQGDGAARADSLRAVQSLASRGIIGLRKRR